jgi:hypothetical protein
MTDKDRGTKPQPNEDLPADEDLEESPEEFVEAEEEFEEEPLSASAETAPAATARGRRGEPAGARQLGSVREGHERVRVDDRLSALFALFAAVLLLGVLILPWAGGFLPAPAEPTLAPLVVPTYNATPSAAPSASATPSATPTVSASPAS